MKKLTRRWIQQGPVDLVQYQSANVKCTCWRRCWCLAVGLLAVQSDCEESVCSGCVFSLTTPLQTDLQTPHRSMNASLQKNNFQTRCQTDGQIGFTIQLYFSYFSYGSDNLLLLQSDPRSIFIRVQVVWAVICWMISIKIPLNTIHSISL